MGWMHYWTGTDGPDRYSVFYPPCLKTHEEWLLSLLRRNGGEVCILELGRKYITRTERKGVGAVRLLFTLASRCLAQVL